MAARLKPNETRVGGPVLPARLSMCAVALAAGAAILPASAAQAAMPAAQLSQPFAGPGINDFYAARGGQPLWLAGDGSAAAKLLDLLRTADADGLDPAAYHPRELDDALRAAWGGKPSKVRKADALLSQAFVAYVSDLKRPPHVAIDWVDPDLMPRAPSPRELLEAAANAPSLDAWIGDMRFMNPIYAGLRNAMVRNQAGLDQQVLRLNLERARALPVGGRYIVVNAAAAELTMYEDGRPVDSMKVVVGKRKNPTPMMAAKIRFASLNPYWYVPADLAAERIAPNVVKEGLGYLKSHGYEVMTDWDGGSFIDPATIDWKAVADGSKQIYVRQLPGSGNSMGRMKFMFPNKEGVYLHDTPQKELLSEASRLFSGGCVRLEDAPRLGRWLFGHDLDTSSKEAELRVDLPKPVPVYITYLTVMPTGEELAIYPDVYDRDKEGLAMAGGGTVAAR